MPADHPLRKIRKLVDEVLGEMSRDFSLLYAVDCAGAVAFRRIDKSVELLIQ